LANAEPKMEKWLFEFSFDLKEYIEQKMEERKEQRRTFAKIAPSSPVNKDTSLKKIISHNSGEKDIGDYANSVQRIKNMMKTKAEMAEEEAVRQKKKK